MSDANATTPRVFIARHGETEWTINGRCTGKAEIPLTPNGVAQVRSTGQVLVGAGKLIDPRRLAHVFVSPRVRAGATLELLVGSVEKERLLRDGRITVTEDIAEWDYGEYEGLTPKQIGEGRRARGLGRWDIWTEGCEGGESAGAVTERLDRLIQNIYKLQAPYIDGGDAPDVLVVAHGHILRAFTKRWLKWSMDFPFQMMMEPGAIGVMSYAHHNIEEPAILIGVGYPQQAA